MSWKITPGWSPADADAAAYITAVETADNQALENGVKVAIDNFVLGCKADGIWSAIKASCILAGARTLNGALVPLVGTAPTNFSFVAGDYNRETGLMGNGSTKYLNSNRSNSADPENNKHAAIYTSLLPTLGGAMLGVASTGSARTLIYSTLTRVNDSASSAYTASLGFIGVSRIAANSYTRRNATSDVTINQTSATPQTQNCLVFADQLGPVAFSNARLAFYSIGESLNLTLLDGRVTTLINAFAAAIP